MTDQELKELIWYGQGDTEPEKALQWLNATLESRVEYETEHKDSGDNYALLVQESWDHYDIDDYIWTYCYNKSHLFGPIDGIEREELGEIVQDYFTMQTYWSAYHLFRPSEGLCLLQVPVEELEICIEQGEAERAGFDWQDVVDASLFASDYALAKNMLGDQLTFYACPDTSWCAVISDADLSDILDNLREEKA